MLYISVIMGLLVGYLTDVWLARFGFKDPARLVVIAVVVGVLVIILTYNGTLAHF
jgi:hypothetical protein